MATTEATPDRGFRRAMLCGAGGFVACLVSLTAFGGGEPPPESEGRLLFSCLTPAVVAGLIIKGRRWSWARVAAVYLAALALFTVLRRLREMGF